MQNPSNPQKQYWNSDSALFEASDSEADQAEGRHIQDHRVEKSCQNVLPPLQTSQLAGPEGDQQHWVESPLATISEPQKRRVQFPIELPQATPGAVPDSPIPSSRRSTPKRGRSQEFDPIANILDSYWDDKDQPISVGAAKRQRFNASKGDRLHDVGRSIWAVAKQKCFRPSYSPLPEGHIRLLILHPGEGDESISMSLVTSRLDESTRYDALSYVWGDDLPLNPVVIFDRSQEPVPSPIALKGKDRLRQALNSKVSVVFVRRNLEAALRRFREAPPKVLDGKVDMKRYWQPRYHKVLWIDALCINQKDNEEKSGQLLRMPEIYRMALKVVIWLGEGTGSSDLSMELIQELVQDRLAGSITKFDITKTKLDSFLELMRCQWFARRWIIQEIFFATDAALYYGKKSHHLDTFNLALARLMRDLQVPGSEIHKVAALQPASLEKLEAYGANVLYKLGSELLEEDNQGERQPSQKLDYLVPKLTAFDAGDPRDIIFGVQNLARRTEGPALPPVDYTASVLDVFTGFVKYACAWRQLDILCRHWAPMHEWLIINYNERERGRVDTVLPSWIPQLENSAFGPPKDVFLGRINGAPFVGETSPLYNASIGAKDVVAVFGTRKTPKTIIERPITKKGRPRPTPRTLLRETYDGTLMVKGLILGKVRVRSDRMIPEIIPRDAIAMGGWQFRKFEGHNKLVEVPDQLWKTLIAKKHRDGSDAEIGDRHACLAMLKRDDIQGDIHIRDLLHDPDFSSDPTRKDYLERARVVCWNRRVFLGGQEEYDRELFGLCPDSTEVGDLVCIIYGLSVPVILRQIHELEVSKLGFKERPPLSRRKPAKSPHHTPRSELFNLFGASTPNRRKRRWTSSPAEAADCSIHPTPPSLFASKPLYKLVGECYVNGMMDGQAIGNNQYLPTEQLFTLV